ncbi:MAG: aminotransferase DegT [Hadesarchaea archaeon DG-33]|nr:MAG: aminotransferase DegT [Hadesarchaea archaeon DG-33]
MRLKMIPVCEPKLGKKELENVIDCIKTNWISSKGKYITEFEEKFSRYCGAKYGIATCNGTTALHLALASLGVKTGDEVIIPSFTMIATANSVTYTGAKPVLVDSEPMTWNMDPIKVEDKITKRTKAVMVVHAYGHPADMNPILEIAEKHDLHVIEDAAEAHGAEYKGKRVGALGDAGCFSFYANKIVTTGEGGMVITNDEKIAEMARLLRDHAFEPKRFIHRYIGFNYRMTNLQAAIGVAQMELIDESVETRRRNAKLYNSLLKDTVGITLPPEAPWAKNVYWMYTVLIEDSFGIGRDELMKHLKERGIDTRSAFYPIHTQPVYAKRYMGEKYPVAEEIGRKGINLPSGNTLTKEQIEFIANAVISARK